MRSSINTALVCAMAILTAALYGCGGNDSLTIAGPDDPGPSPVVATSHSSGNDMIAAANNGPRSVADATKSTSGDHATGLVTRIGTSGVGPAVPSGVDPADPSKPSESIVQSSQTAEPAVNVEVSWPRKAPAPTLSVELGRDAFGAFRRILPGDVRITSKTPGNAIPNLGAGWHGEALQRRVDEGGRTVYTAVYTDITPPARVITDKYIDFANPEGNRAERVDKLLDNASVPEAEIRHIPGNIGVDLGAVTPIVFPVVIEGKARFAAVSRDWSRPVPLGGHLTPYLSNEGGDPVNHAGRQLDKNTEAPILLHDVRLLCVNGGADSCKGVHRGNQGSLEGLWRLSTWDWVKDNHYLSLGVWLSLPDLADGRFDVGAFANGSEPYTRTALNALRGTAKYEGPATGIWAKGVYERPRASTDGRPDDCDCPVVRDTKVGAFKAQARLWADFGTATDAPTVDGYVADFTENGESLGSWFVQLNDAKPKPGDDATTTTLLNGNTSGEADGRLLQGQWGVGFFRRGVGEPQLLHPGYAAGTFSASTVDENTPLDLNALHIIGAFGTERQ